jgi:uncharacterized protein (TIGR02611 family)
MAPILHRFARHAWRGIVLVVGLTLITAGLVMMVTPGPGIAAILAGLALLSTEFAWARRVLDWVRHRFTAARDEVRRRAARRSRDAEEAKDAAATEAAEAERVAEGAGTEGVAGRVARAAEAERVGEAARRDGRDVRSTTP